VFEEMVTSSGGHMRGNRPPFRSGEGDKLLFPGNGPSSPKAAVAAEHKGAAIDGGAPMAIHPSAGEQGCLSAHEIEGSQNPERQFFSAVGGMGH
jgi:hypothetical protein